MPYIHNAKNLPSQQAIQSVCCYCEQFEEDDIDFEQLLTSLKKTVIENNFMVEHDNWKWATRHGADYLNNPKLFAHAPLNYVCAFISEVFKNFEIEDIKHRFPIDVFKFALKRLTSFSN